MIDNTEHEQAGLGLGTYLDVLRRRWWIVVLVVAVAVGGSLAYSLTQEKVYKATTRLVVGQGQGLPQVQFGNQVQTFTATMAELLQSNVVAANVIANLRLENQTPQSLKSKMNVSINPETAVIKLAVLDHDPQQAQRLTQEIALVFTQLVKERFANQPQPQPTTPAGEAERPITVTIFDPAAVNPTPVSPRPVRNAALAFVLGLVLGLLAAFLREYFDRQLRTREAVERAFGLPVIGQIPFQRQRRKDKRTVFESGEGAEAFRALRANLQYLAVRRPLQTILVTSASPEQGKTTIAANLALAIARSGQTVAVVEGDLRRPRLDDAFALTGAPYGLTSVLVGTNAIESSIQRVRVGASGSSTEVAVLPSGPLPPNPSELLSSFQMRDVLEQLSRTHDYVLVDSPPLLLVADALELARMVDGVVIAVRRNRASTDDARELRALVERLDIHLVGVVLTDVEPVGAYGTYRDDGRVKAKEAAAPEVSPLPAPPAPAPATPEPAETAPASRDDF